MSSDLLPIVQSQIRSCTKCWLHTQAKQPVPYHGPMPARLVCVGEAPGDVEDEQGQPFVGKSGKYLRMALKEAGIQPESVGMCNVVSCWPGRHKKGFRVPALDEQAACRGNLMLQLVSAEPKLVILLGGTALNAFRPDLKITKDRGRPLMLPGMDGVVALPTFHPSAVLRVHHLKQLLAKDLRQAAWRLANFGGNLRRKWPDRCRLCGRELDVYDPDGVAWCRWHEPKGDVGGTAVPTTLDIS